MSVETKKRVAYFAPELINRQGDSEDLDQFQLETKNELRKFSTSLIIALITYTMDVVSDMILAVGYAVNGEYFKCVATLGVVYFSSLVTTYISLMWYRMVVRQDQIEVRSERREYPDSSVTMLEFELPPPFESFHARTVNSTNKCVLSLYIFVLFIFQLAPVISLIISLKMVWKYLRMDKAELLARRAAQTETQRLQEDEGLEAPQLRRAVHDELKLMAMIKIHGDYERMYESFLEAIPQSLLQISLLLSDVIAADGHYFKDFSSAFRVVAILLSLLSLKGAMWDYNSSVVTRTFLVGGIAQRDIVSGLFAVLKSFWHVLIPVARVLTLCFVATRFSYVAAVVVIVLYWLLMALWLKKHFQGWSRFQHVVLYLAECWIFVWLAVSSRTAKSFSFYSMYYFIFLVDCVAVFSINMLNVQNDHYILTIITSVALTCYLIGILFKLIYFIKIKKDSKKKQQQFITKFTRELTYKVYYAP